MTTTLDHALVLLIVLFVTHSIVRLQPAMKRLEFDGPTRVWMYWSSAAFLWVSAGAVIGAWLYAGRPLEDLGLSRGRLPALAVVIAVAFVAGFALDSWRQLGSDRSRARTLARWARDTPFMPRNAGEFVHFSVLAVSAGVCEEIVFRGHLVSYVSWWTNSSWPGLAFAVGAPAALFAIAHLYQGWAVVGRIAAMALAFGTLFVLTESLLVPIILHAGVDLVAGLLTMRYSRAIDAHRNRGAENGPPRGKTQGDQHGTDRDRGVQAQAREGRGAQVGDR